MLQSQWSPDGIALVDIKPPPLADGWVRLRVAACGICGSDLHQYRRELRARTGGAPGHECVGTVLDGPKGLRDALYAVEPWTHCRSCDLCLAGLYHLCAKSLLIGGQLPGGLAEFIDAPAYGVHVVDASVPPLEASMAEPLAVCVRGVHLAELQMDSRALVLGGGSIGLLTGLLARDRATSVAITVRYPHQRVAAERLGLTAISEQDAEAWARDHEPDVVIETVGGHADTINQAIRYCRRGGRVVVLGIFSKPTPIEGMQLVTKEVHVTGSIIYGPGRRGSEFRAGVGLLPRYLGEIRALQTHQFPLSQVRDAFECADDKKSGAIKVTLLAE